jgi:hypothetical protein
MSDTETPKQEKESTKSIPVIFYLSLAVIAGLAGYIFYNHTQVVAEKQKMEQRMTSDSLRISDLDSKYKAVMDTLAAYKGLNRELDSILAIKEHELSKCRNSFLSSVQKNKLTDAEYNKQIADLQSIVASLQMQIAQMQADNKLLVFQRDSLGRIVLVQADSILYLADSNANLEKRVLIGSLLKPTLIDASGIRTKGNGKEKTTKNDSKATQLRVCFTVPANDIALAEKKIFYIRFISPDGKTLVTKDSSRVFSKAETGEQIVYSTTAKINYKNVIANTCGYFQEQDSFASGIYTAEIYQDGYLIGSTKFELK